MIIYPNLPAHRHTQALENIAAIATQVELSLAKRKFHVAGGIPVKICIRDAYRNRTCHEDTNILLSLGLGCGMYSSSSTNLLRPN